MFTLGQAVRLVSFPRFTGIVVRIEDSRISGITGWYKVAFPVADTGRTEYVSACELELASA